MKVNKRDFYIDWKLEIKSASGDDAPMAEMSEIIAYAQGLDDRAWIYACGYKWVDPDLMTYRNAATMKFSTSGDIQFLDVWASDTVDQNDTCKSVAFDEDNNEVGYMLEVTSSSLRPSYSSVSKYSMDSAEAMIVIMKQDGSF